VRESDLLGVGLYSVHEAARMTAIPSDSIRRWLWPRTLAGRRQEPLWRPQLPSIGGVKGLSFRDLIEIQFVDRFRQRGVSLRVIRRTIDLATRLLDESYLLSSVRFKTDGKSILAEVAERSGEGRWVLDLATGQHLLDFVLPRLYDALEYSDLDDLLRWWPLGKGRRVVVDPRKSFGRPIVTEGVPTAILAGSHEVEESIPAVARWFEVSEESVRDALEFERSLKAA
jgi:uncharacterized protein (DUF433 family)/DNA-binding transcriptional MerR regulator